MWAILGASGAFAAVDRSRVSDLDRETEILERRVDLAEGNDFYLVLDRAEGRLDLMLKGAVLHAYDVRSVRVGVPRVAFVTRDVPGGLEGRIWSGGTLDPPRELDRLELEAPPPDPSRDDGELEPPPIPPTPEEAFPVPHRFHIRFEGGLALEVRRSYGDSEGSPGLLSSVAAAVSGWIADRLAVLRPIPEDRVRLRLVVSPQDADSIYRGLPPGTRLLIIPPG